MFASRAAFFKFAAGGRAPFVNATDGFFAGLAIKGCATRRAVVGATHAAGVLGDGRGQTGGHIAAAFFVFVHRKIHPKARAASAAGGALAHGLVGLSVRCGLLALSGLRPSHAQAAKTP